MIQRLLITNLRILQQVEISGLSQCNIIIGKNGSGKTSLLEAVFLLSRGKSFRHHQPRHYVTHGAEETTVFAQFSHTASMAVAKSTAGESKLRLNTANVATQSELTRELPVILLDPTQLDLLDHGSGERRALLDWLVFHINPIFYKTWLSYQRALKQRNRILKENDSVARLSHTQKMQLLAWDEQLATLGNDIHTMRQEVMSAWQPLFKKICSQFLPQYEEITMRYTAGFDVALGLKEVLQARQPKDLELGYTRVGVHRADVMIFTGETGAKKQAADVFSRGEKKLLIMALKLSQLQLLTSFKRKAVVLLDDINAELDKAAVARLLTGLHGCESQVFMTSLTDEVIPQVENLWQQHTQFFIEKGEVSVL